MGHFFGLGLLAGLIAALYITALYLAKDYARGWHVPDWLKPAAAGLAVGIVGIFLPQVFSVGYSTIDAIFAGEQMGVPLLIVLLFAKLAWTAISIGGGFPGGVLSNLLRAAADSFMQTRHHGLAVVSDTGDVVGILTVQDLNRDCAWGAL